ncbi:MAG: hypothetical protein SF028_13350 [Candidatus Sumerlaeia bacterium]|nr:hypothetical protein [Candidatus Sumerlaeia bacterium]
MKLFRTAALAAGIAAAIALTGCSTKLGQFTMMTTGAPQFDSMDNAPLTNDVRGESGRYWILFIPTASQPDVENAVNDALMRGNGDFMERVEVYSKGWSAILVSYDGYHVRGAVGNSKYNRGQ